MLTAVVIPARGGSKRLPRKNILEVGGLPMLAHPILCAQESRLFDRIFVSTEDVEIAGVARQYGAEIVQRPPGIAGDKSTVVQVCLHALETFPEIDLMCCVYATAIFLKPELLVASHRLLFDDAETDFVMGVSEYEHHPVQALRAESNGNLSPMWPEWRDVQSQNYPRLVVSNGTFYWARRAALLAEKTFYGQHLKGVEVPSEQVSDIDTLADLQGVIHRLGSRKEAVNR